MVLQSQANVQCVGIGVCSLLPTEKDTEGPDYLLGTAIIPRKNTVKYLGVFLDHKLNWKDHIANLTMEAKKRIRYIRFLFSKKCQGARITLFKSLVLPLFDYCSTVYNPRLKGLVNALEDCQRLLLRSIDLGAALEDTWTERYCHRLRQLGLEPLILKRIKASLILAYKMMSNLVPVSTPFLQPHFTATAVPSAAGGTRAATALRAHPFPLQLAGPQDDGWIAGSSDKSFAFLISQIWKNLPLDAADYETLSSFSLAIENVRLSKIKFENFTG
ncbi:hypothetical protein RvY_14878 [Ramazzottius varieornatus]|uniref:Uncharacterized protein n=1 Tax=Ramazzottius varieornatus TaxID=947166 RepID=A0A1D1VST8_RAMVA|nr:hypothetical protein RvY_14878 [Ramazzottius varieornatus]